MSLNKHRYIVFASTLGVGSCFAIFSAYAACYGMLVQHDPMDARIWAGALQITGSEIAAVAVPFVLALLVNHFIKAKSRKGIWLLRLLTFAVFSYLESLVLSSYADFSPPHADHSFGVRQLTQGLIITGLGIALLTIPFLLMLLVNRFIKIKSPVGIWVLRVLTFAAFLFLESFILSLDAGAGYQGDCAKPVIYLYPKKKQEVRVELFYRGKLTASYPVYDQTIQGWKVMAYPDGHLINITDHQTYSYLFWEGIPDKMDNNFSTGFVVAGKDTAAFLQKTLKELGLTPKEYNEFIVYWLPKMEDNPYNLIHFAGKKYTDIAPLEISPKPDSMLRVFMEYKPLTEAMNILPQKITPFARKGFAVIEWGGIEVK